MPDPSVRHEADLARVAPLVKAMLGTLVIVLAGSAALWAFYGEPDQVAAEQPEVPPDPEIQDNPAADLDVYQEHFQTRLNSSGWVDRDVGIVHLPIDRAMDLLVARGLEEGAP